MSSKNYNNELEKQQYFFRKWRADWNTFVSDVLKATLDKEQQAIIRAVQHEPMVAVASGTARGKDFVAACAALCFMYLTPRWDKRGNLVKNTKIALTAPCYDEKTEILTRNGFKFFKDLTFDDEVAQMSEDGYIEYVHPTDIMKYRYKGEMVGVRTKLIDLLVTPNHKCLWDNCNVGIDTAKKVSAYHNEMCAKGYWTQYDTARELHLKQGYVAKCLKKAQKGYIGDVRYAKDIYGHTGQMPKVAKWNGKDEDKDWCEFLGFWFADGSITFDEKRRKYRISVCQKKSQRLDYVDGLINKVQRLFKNKVHRYVRKDGMVYWELYEKSITEEFKDYGTQYVRRIPAYIKEANGDCIRAFLHGYFIGDGWKSRARLTPEGKITLTPEGKISRPRRAK